MCACVCAYACVCVCMCVCACNSVCAKWLILVLLPNCNLEWQQAGGDQAAEADVEDDEEDSEGDNDQ